MKQQTKPSKLTKQEQEAINELKSLAANWPTSLWLFTGGHDGVCVMKLKDDGERAVKSHGGMDDNFIVEHIPHLLADGGDW